MKYVVVCQPEYYEGEPVDVIGPFETWAGADAYIDRLPKEGEHGYCKHLHLTKRLQEPTP